MKKMLFSTSLITALSLSITLGSSSSTSSFAPKPLTEISHVTHDTRSFDSLLAMGTYENLKAYHIGLRSIFPNYQIPSAQDLLSSIRSHQQFVGYLNRDEALHRLSAKENSYFIFEETDNRGHFYVAYSGGLRHFTVNNKKVSGLDNGVSYQYPTFSYFLCSTFLA